MSSRSTKKQQNPPVKRRELDSLDASHIWDDEHRTVYLVGDIDKDMMREVIEKIVTLSERAPKKPITLIINTHGGDVDDTFMLYDLMNFVPTPIRTVGLGGIMSAGCLLLASGTKGMRLMGKNARLMYHCGWDFFGGTVFEIKASLAAFEVQEELYDRRFAEATGMTLADVQKLYNKQGPTADMYLSAEKCLELGIVDELV